MFLLDEDHTQWASKLAYVELAINSTVNISMGYAFFQLLYGAKVKLSPYQMLQTPDIDPRAADFVRHTT